MPKRRRTPLIRPVVRRVEEITIFTDTPAYLDAHATPAERAEANRLAREDVLGNGVKIHDLMVSCYVADGEGGRPEEVHEWRISDRSCRCGEYKPRV